MSQDLPVVRREVELTNYYGLHLRLAGKFVELANRFQSDIRVSHNGAEVNGKSVLDLTLLAAECGVLLQLEARGNDASEAIDALVKLVATEFHDDGEDRKGSAT